MSFLPAVIAVASAVLKVGAAHSDAQSKIFAANYQTAVALNNAKIAEKNAGLAGEQSQLQQQRKDQEFKALYGEQLAQQSASGLDVLGRSQMQTREGTRKVRDASALDIRQQGDAIVQKYFEQAAGFKANAQLAQRQAKDASAAGWINAFGSVIGGVGDVTSFLSSARSTKKSFA